MEDPAITLELRLYLHVCKNKAHRGLMTWKYYPEFGGPLHSQLALETASTSCVTPSGGQPRLHRNALKV